MNRVAKNATWIIACRIAQAVFALLINMLTARYLGPSKYGIITYASSLTAFILPVVQLGFNNTLVLEVVTKPESEGATMGTSMFLSFCSSVCCIIGITAFSFIANRDDKTTVTVCFLYSLTLIFQAFELMRYWFQAKYLSKYTSIVTLGAYAVVSVFRIYLIIGMKSIYWFAISYSLDYAIISLSIIVIYFKRGGRKLAYSKQDGRAIFNKSKHYILSGIMVTMFAQTDKIMIKLMIDEVATGYYGAAVSCAGLTTFIFVAIIDSFRPSILEAKTKDITLFNHRMTILYSIVIYLSLIQSAIMTLLARFIILVLYGSEFSLSATALQIVVWYTTFSYIGAVRDVWILANNKQSILWKINISGVFTNVFLNAILIPRLGINGAAVASLVTQLFTNVIIGYILKQVRPNNAIMIAGLNPKYCITAFKRVLRWHRD